MLRGVQEGVCAEGSAGGSVLRGVQEGVCADGSAG